MTAAICGELHTDPCPILLYMPTDTDAREIMIDEIDPAFQNTPVLQGLMPSTRDGKSTITRRHLMGGGSLFALGAATPKNFRRYTGKVIAVDEIDAMKISAEGDPIKILEKRALSYADSKFWYGSTPTEVGISLIDRLYQRSDQRVFEMPCPHCEDRFHLLFEHLSWPEGQIEQTVANCPNCGAEIEEKHKPWMEENGEWRATKPEIKDHAGFWDSALSSLHPKATWAYLVKEYLEAKEAGPFAMMVFYNTLLGMPWSNALEAVADEQLLARAEDFRIVWRDEGDFWDVSIPREVLFITCGVDVQPDRLEITLVGWSRTQRYILGHHVILGPADVDATWQELEWFLQRDWKHPLGGTIRIEATAVDSGDGNTTQHVYDFCVPRFAQRIFAIKGDEGDRPVIKASSSKGSQLFIVGVDQVKMDISLSLPRNYQEENGDLVQNAFRFSDSLSLEWFKQFNSERRSVAYVNGRPKVRWVRVENRQAEALDSAVYAIAVKNLCRFDFERRTRELMGSEPKSGGIDFEELGKKMQM
jgi:phage terminase large subunit GpA-like protein